MNKDYFSNLSKKYCIPLLDIIFIALNRYGVNYGNGEEDRVRFTLKTPFTDQTFFFAVCANTFYKSPFTIKDNMLLMDGEILGELIDLEKDTCTETYFRNNKKALTLNSNSRSSCRGCRFCGTYKLEAQDREHFDNEKEMCNYIEELLIKNKLQSMRNIDDVTIVTGCFKTEEDLIKHIISLKHALKNFDFNGTIGYVGSQIQTKQNLYRLKNEIEKFNLLVTIEKFVEREKIMRPEKYRLTLEIAKDFLLEAKNIGFGSNFLYILGLEDLKKFEYYIKYFSEAVNKFPQVQIYQNYSTVQENYRCDEAKDLEYYLKARKILENIFGNTGIEPNPWENYRSLFYTEYNNKIYRK